MKMTERSDRFSEIKNRLCEFATKDRDIWAVIAIGSSTRSDIPADEYSDLDLFVVTEEPDPWFSGEYPKKLGRVSISFLEPTLGGGKERRCIFDEDKDVDMIVLTPDQFETAVREGVAGWVMNRGYRILYDAGYMEEKCGSSLSDMLKKYVSSATAGEVISKTDYLNLVNDFYFHNIWSCKKLLRGELWSAKMCIDAYLKRHLLHMIEQYQLAQGSEDVWHDGRFLDSWADPEVREELKDCFAHYDSKDCGAALMATHKLFAKIAPVVAEKLMIDYPREAEHCAYDYLSRNLGRILDTGN